MKQPSLLHSILSARGKVGLRDVTVAAVGLAVVYFLWTSWMSHGGGTESALLEQHMNSDAKGRVWDVKSSFDWSSIKFRYPPGDPIPLPSGPVRLPRIQRRFDPESAAVSKIREARRQQVKELFQKNWRSYRRFAWMRDALLPISGSGRDQFSGWAATLVDSLDTLWIMGLKDEFDEAVDAVADIDFGTSTSSRVNTFETNIRYLGGLLAAYDLSKRSVLLAKAVEVGDMLFAGFNTENRMPVDFFDMEQSKSGEGLPVEESVVSASPGTLLLEFTRLSQVTGNPKYYTAITRITDLFYAGQDQTLLSGMWPVTVSMSSANVVQGNLFTLGSGSDSLYEYIVKMNAMLGGRESKYKTMSEAWMDTANTNLFFRPMIPDDEDILISGNAIVDPDGRPNLRPESEHLACFLGGVYALGGRLFSRNDYVDIGSKLTLGCAYAYEAMPTGMMPEQFSMVACESRETCPWNETRWIEEEMKRFQWKEDLPLGFTTAKDRRYILRPEAIESIFVLYRVTGRSEVQELAWEMFKAVVSGTETEYANAAVLDVTKADYPLPREDYMESFWLAETLKYFYLALSPPDLISLDEFVLNTEAHPFRRPQ